MADIKTGTQPDNVPTTPPPPPPPPPTSSSSLQQITQTDSSNTSPISQKPASRSNSECLVRKVLQQSAESAQTERRESKRGSESDGYIYTQSRAFKKSSQNGKLTLYLASRDLVVTAGKIDKLQGVLLIDPEILQDKKVYGQVTLTFRYGREDEEVMGLKFCNEAIMSLAQLYPPYHAADRQESITPFQEVLIKRFYPNAHPFTMAVTPLAPPSVQLVPAKEYNGAPIGTSYDIRVYAAERPDEKLTRKMQIIKMGIRVIQGANTPPAPKSAIYSIPSATESIPGSPLEHHSKPSREKSISGTEDANEIKAEEEPPIPHAVVEKQFLLSDGRVRLEASLDKAIYSHGDSITVHVNVTNHSGKSVKRIEADIVQHVDVCMFSNGKFKNIVAQMSSRDGCPVEPGFSLSRTYILRPEKGTTKNWIALEDDPGYSKTAANLASTVVCAGNSPEDRNVFAIYVSYYVKIKIVVSPMGEWIGGVVSLKLPFTLMHSNTEPELYGTPSTPRTSCRILDKIETVDDPNEDQLPYIDKDTSDEDQSDDANDKKNEDSVPVKTNGETKTYVRAAVSDSSPIGTTTTTTTVITTIETSTKAPTSLTTKASIETSSSKQQERRDSMSNVDLIEHYTDKENKESNSST